MLWVDFRGNNSRICVIVPMFSIKHDYNMIMITYCFSERLAGVVRLFFRQLNNALIAILFAISLLPIFTGCGAGGQPGASESVKGFSVVAESIPTMRNVEARDCGDPAKIEAAIGILEELASRFPAELPKRAGDPAIYICEGLTGFGVPTPAITMRDGGKTFIYVDAGAARKIDAAFTHELFHALEFNAPVDEDAWAQINPYERYLRDLASPGDIVRYEPNKTPAFEPGFASDYARFSGMEDRAELFAVLYSGRGLIAKERAAMLCDPYLMEKIAYLKNYLEESGLPMGNMKDNIFGVDTRYSCQAFVLTRPELASTGPSEAYPNAKLKAGQTLADSGYEKGGIKMLYDEDRRRVYAPPVALELLDGETVEIEFPQEPGA